MTDIGPTIMSKNKKQQSYGFANRYSNMFAEYKLIQDDFSQVIHLHNPDFTKPKNRRKLRIKEENQKWNDDHYLADTMETEHLESIFNYTPPWNKFPVLDLDEDEINMLSLHKKINLNFQSSKEERLCELQLIDILLCYTYNKRITEGDDSVESGWTINNLSATLSWFEVFEDMKSVVISFFRRCLTFPLYRNWKLIEKIKKDVVNILEIGPKQVTHCLLEVKKIFYESENRYILNILYVNDLCQFSYFMTKDTSLNLSKQLEKIFITKNEVDFDIVYLEMGAYMVLEEEKIRNEEENNIKAIGDKISKLSLNKGDNSPSKISSSSESDSD